MSVSSSEGIPAKSTAGPPQQLDGKPYKHQSPIPERKMMSKEKEEERRDCIVRNYSPQVRSNALPSAISVIKNGMGCTPAQRSWDKWKGMVVEEVPAFKYVNCVETSPT